MYWRGTSQNLCLDRMHMQFQTYQEVVVERYHVVSIFLGRHNGA